jgi:DNA/RNA endonuclease G (NUC1)
VDLFYSPVKSLIREELPLSESFPSTYNPNRSKFYYSNVTANNEGHLNFETLFQNLESQIKKFSSQENKTVLIFDNLSLIPNSGRNLLDEINNLVKFTSDNVRNKKNEFFKT